MEIRAHAASPSWFAVRTVFAVQDRIRHPDRSDVARGGSAI
jgi:hypothetical protein